MHSSANDSNGSIDFSKPNEKQQGGGGRVPPPPGAALAEGMSSNTCPKSTYESDYDPYPCFVPGIDNLTLFLWESFLPVCLSYLEKVFNSPFDTKSPHDGYQSHVRLLNGLSVKWGHPRRRHARIEFTGQALRSLPEEIFQHLVLTLAPMVDHASRFDAAFNDMTAYGMTPKDLYEKLEHGAAGCKYYPAFFQRTENGNYPIRWMSDVDTGDTLYIGNKGADLLLRNYDKDGYSRYELQMRKDYATQAWLQLVEAAKKPLGAIGQLAVDLVFGRLQIKERKCTETTNDPIAKFWSKFQKRVKATPLRLVKQKVESSIVSKVNWIETGVAKTFAEVVNYQRYLGNHNYVQQLLRKGQSRMDAHSYALSEPVSDREIEVNGKLILKRRIFNGPLTNKDLSPSRVHEAVLDYLQSTRHRYQPQ
jgi:DNA relaxase NicK